MEMLDKAIYTTNQHYAIEMGASELAEAGKTSDMGFTKGFSHHPNVSGGAIQMDKTLHDWISLNINNFNKSVQFVHFFFHMLVLILGLKPCFVKFSLLHAGLMEFGLNHCWLPVLFPVVEF